MSVIDATRNEETGIYQVDIATLTDKQSMFVYYYCGSASANATRAARMAGYGGDDASLAQQGSHLLRNVKVNACIRARMEELSASQAEVTKRLTDWIREDIEDVAQEIKAARPGQPAVIKLDRGYQVKAAETLARIHGMIIDRSKQEQTGQVTVTIHYDKTPLPESTESQ